MRQNALFLLPALLLLLPSAAHGQTANVVPSNLDFGTVQIGEQQTLQVTITSGEATPLQIFSITITDDPSSAFEITGFDPDPIPTFLLEGESVTVDVRFSPASPGPHAGVMTIHNNDHISEYIDVPLSGTGTTSDTIVAHIGSNDPLTESFDFWPTNGSLTTMPIASDNGWATWQIANTGGTQQAVYIQAGGIGPWLPGGSGLTQEQIDDILANGFTMSVRARVISGPVYDESGTQLANLDIAVAGFVGFRFDIALASDGLGNTLAVLPSSIALGAGGFNYPPFGSPLLVAGTDYHLYQLSYDPVSEEATLFIDGVERATGYPGALVSGGVQSSNFGLAFAAMNYSTGNFALVRLESGQLQGPVPTPSMTVHGIILAVASLLLAAAWGIKRAGNASV